MRFYDAGGGYLGKNNVRTGVAGTLSTDHRAKGGSFTTPAGTARVRIYLLNYMTSGWVAVDDV